MLRTTLVLTVALVLSGCAAMMEQWRDQHCNYDGAFADGMNDARAGHAMNIGQYDTSCHAETVAEARTGYREGFTEGNASTVVVHHEHHGQRVASGRYQPVCKWNTDCGSGGWCRDRGDGVSVCMNQEPRGSFCKWATDCASGLFCRDRGDGLQQCM